MKKVLYVVIIVFALVLGFQSAAYSRPLRLHVLANSDSAEDQRIKLA